MLIHCNSSGVRIAAEESGYHLSVHAPAVSLQEPKNIRGMVAIEGYPRRHSGYVKVAASSILVQFEAS
jgi:hypothetical protein